MRVALRSVLSKADICIQCTHAHSSRDRQTHTQIRNEGDNAAQVFPNNQKLNKYHTKIYIIC